MKIDKVTAVFFSPTKGTETYVCEIARRLSSDFSVLNLTDPLVRRETYTFSENDLVIFGAPVYAGRLPELECGIFDRIHGNRTPAIYNVSYGNREFEDALLEEKDICEQNGFIGIAAGTWIAPHTFSDKIASGRPDSQDMEQVEQFTARIKEILKGDLKLEGSLQVPGDHPYRDGKSIPFHPSGNKHCTNCGICTQTCPVEAISPKTPQKTDEKKCINCFACVKNCPANARGIFNPLFKVVIGKLEKDLTKERKKPHQFYERTY